MFPPNRKAQQDPANHTQERRRASGNSDLEIHDKGVNHIETDCKTNTTHMSESEGLGMGMGTSPTQSNSESHAKVEHDVLFDQRVAELFQNDMDKSQPAHETPNDTLQPQLLQNASSSMFQAAVASVINGPATSLLDAGNPAPTFGNGYPNQIQEQSVQQLPQEWQHQLAQQPAQQQPPSVIRQQMQSTKDDEEEESEGPEKPKRSLSAYNIFFQTERKRLLKVLPVKGKKPRKSHGKIGFADMARTIAAKWKAITPEDKAEFQKLAALDKERYRNELIEYQRNKSASLQSGFQTPAARGGSSASAPNLATAAPLNQPLTDTRRGYSSQPTCARQSSQLGLHGSDDGGFQQPPPRAPTPVIIPPSEFIRQQTLRNSNSAAPIPFPSPMPRNGSTASLQSVSSNASGMLSGYASSASVASAATGAGGESDVQSLGSEASRLQLLARSSMSNLMQPVPFAVGANAQFSSAFSQPQAAQPYAVASPAPAAASSLLPSLFEPQPLLFNNTAAAGGVETLDNEPLSHLLELLAAQQPQSHP